MSNAGIFHVALKNVACVNIKNDELGIILIKGLLSSNDMDFKIRIQSVIQSILIRIQISLTSSYMIQNSIISYSLLVLNCLITQSTINVTCDILRYDMRYWKDMQLYCFNRNISYETMTMVNGQ